MNSKSSKFNLLDEPWIPVIDQGLVSLCDIFSVEQNIKWLSGNPVQKIAILKLLLAITQAACTPQDDLDWEGYSEAKISGLCLEYLQKHYDKFFLYDDVHPFLQMPSIKKARAVSLAVACPEVSVGNNSVLTQYNQNREFSDADKAIVIVQLMSMAFGGKKTDKTISLSGVEKKASAQPGVGIGFKGFLHNFWIGDSILETLKFNLLTQEDIAKVKVFTQGVGVAPWELMPTSEEDQVANNLKSSLMGRLVAVNRFCLLADDGVGIHYVDGLIHAGYNEGLYDPSVAIKNDGKKTQAIWVNVSKKPWRELTALTAKREMTGSSGYYCYYIQYGLEKFQHYFRMQNISKLQYGLEKFQHYLVLYSAGVQVSSNAGEQYVSGTDDYLESYLDLPLSETWITDYDSCIEDMDKFSKELYVKVSNYFKKMGSDPTPCKKNAEKACLVFWQIAERYAQELIEAIYNEDNCKKRCIMRKIIVLIGDLYSAFCAKNSPRQLSKWAECKPNIGKYIQNYKEIKDVA